MFENTRRYLEKLGLPGSDLYDLPTSGAKFDDGADFRIEVPTINTSEAAASLVKRAEELGIQINRITETFGMFRHTQTEIKEFVAIAKGHGAELIMSTGPRATYDTGATVQTGQGVRIGYRLRGVEQLVRAIEDIKRGVELGVRTFLIYDEGMLYVVTQMRNDGELPADVGFKVSAHCGHCNPASFKLWAEMGADSINPVRDLQLPMIAALRAAVPTPIDCHTDNPPASGGFIRNYEAPEIVRLAAPVHLKTGNSAVGGHGQLTTAENGRRMAEQASLVVEFVQRYMPEAKQSGPRE
jgi:hypothetical protein